MFLSHGVTAHCNRRYATCRYVVGVERFELPTFRSLAGRSARLSYAPILLVDPAWLDPTSSCLQSRRFPDLSYRPIIWCSRQGSNLHCTDSQSASSTEVGTLEHACHKGGSRLRWIPYDDWSSKRVSNPWPSTWQADVLPLHQCHLFLHIADRDTLDGCAELL